MLHISRSQYGPQVFFFVGTFEGRCAGCNTSNLVADITTISTISDVIIAVIYKMQIFVTHFQ